MTLGKTGIKVTRLAQGTGTNGVGKTSNQIARARLRTASPSSCARASTRASRSGTSPTSTAATPTRSEALKTVERDKVVILTKTHASTEKEMRADLDRFRKEIGTDRIDIVLLHCMMSADWPQKKAGAMAVLVRGQGRRGSIRAHGVSCHDFGALKTAAASDWVDVDLARLNPAGAIMDAPVAQVLSVLAR